MPSTSLSLLLSVFLLLRNVLAVFDVSGTIFQAPMCAKGNKRVLSIEDYLVHNPADIRQRVFDYIIVGGGPTGLTAAARLSENPRINVLLIESGFWESDRDPAVSNFTQYGRVFGSVIDHQFTTKTQAVGHRVHTIHSGHGLGGSTLINGGAWTRPAKIQIDSWEKVFGNDGWTWDGLSPFMKKAENVRAPTPAEQVAGMYLDASCHGREGLVQVGPLDTKQRNSPLMKAFMDTAKDMRLPLQHDLSCGNPRGVSMFPVTITAEGKRCDAGRALLPAIIERPNLTVLVGQWVGKVLLDNSKDIPTAIGVQYGRYKGPVFESHVNREVLLATGTLVSPLILEQSGIGMSQVLESAGVKQVVELPVGVNQQDQANTPIVNSVYEDAVGQGEVAYFASFNETFGDFAPAAHAMLNNKTLLEHWAEQVVARGGFHNAELLMVQYENYINHIQNHDVAFSEILLDTWGQLEFSVWDLLPFGRGYIHIRDSDPYLRDVENDPQYLSTELDVLGQAAVTKLARELALKTPLAKYCKQELVPGLNVVPKDAPIDAWANWVKSNYRANFHSVGTCSMMKRELGGVVDNKARVYGTRNLRVIDASILPTQISSHMIAVLYGVAEKIAASVVEDYDEAIATQDQVV